jgi:hypothetical protein
MAPFATGGGAILSLEGLLLYSTVAAVLNIYAALESTGCSVLPLLAKTHTSNFSVKSPFNNMPSTWSSAEAAIETTTAFTNEQKEFTQYLADEEHDTFQRDPERVARIQYLCTLRDKQRNTCDVYTSREGGFRPHKKHFEEQAKQDTKSASDSPHPELRKVYTDSAQTNWERAQEVQSSIDAAYWVFASAREAYGDARDAYTKDVENTTKARLSQACINDLTRHHLSREANHVVIHIKVHSSLTLRSIVST